MQPIVVTRHPALVEYLVEKGIVPPGTEAIPTVRPEQVEGRHVIGVLPLFLAARAEKVTVVMLNIPAHLRGAELSLEQMREFATGIQTFVVNEV
jgi:putative CRISPR-associated protein (TIGR02620 family)